MSEFSEKMIINVDKLQDKNNEYLDRLECKEYERTKLEQEINLVKKGLDDLIDNRNSYVNKNSFRLRQITGISVGLISFILLNSIFKLVLNVPFSKFIDSFVFPGIYSVILYICTVFGFKSFFELYLNHNSLKLKEINDKIDKQECLYESKNKELDNLMSLINELNWDIDSNNILIDSFNRRLIDEYRKTNNVEIECCLNKEELLDNIRKDTKCKRRVLKK